MIQRLKEKASKSWGQLTPEQASQMGKLLLVIGLAGVARGARVLWPSMPTALIATIVFTAIMAYCLKACGPQLGKYYFILGLVGGSLNNAVVLANHGRMPAVNQQIAEGFYIPMRGAALPHLGDWILGGISPGDLLLLTAAVGVVGTLIWRSIQHKREDGTYEPNATP